MSSMNSFLSFVYIFTLIHYIWMFRFDQRKSVVPSNYAKISTLVQEEILYNNVLIATSNDEAIEEAKHDQASDKVAILLIK